MPKASLTEQNLQARLDWLKARSVWWAFQLSPPDRVNWVQSKQRTLKKERPIFNIRHDGEVVMFPQLVTKPIAAPSGN